ncbi:MAG: tetratricopeptide repeat protein, partial [Armatimonadota bacterium]
MLARRPHCVEALNNLGVIAQRERKPGEARELWSRVVELDPGHPAALFNLALLDVLEGDARAAVPRV